MHVSGFGYCNIWCPIWWILTKNVFADFRVPGPRVWNRDNKLEAGKLFVLPKEKWDVSI